MLRLKTLKLLQQSSLKTDLIVKIRNLKTTLLRQNI